MEADIHVSVMAAMLTLLARRTPFSSSALIVSALVLDRSTVGRSYSGLARRTCFLVRGRRFCSGRSLFAVRMVLIENYLVYRLRCHVL